MKINVGATERVIRAVVGLILIWAALYFTMPAVWVWILSILGLVLLATGLLGICPIYYLFKIDTSK
jgi:hypothetical protein